MGRCLLAPVVINAGQLCGSRLLRFGFQAVVFDSRDKRCVQAGFVQEDFCTEALSQSSGFLIIPNRNSDDADIVLNFGL